MIGYIILSVLIYASVVGLGVWAIQIHSREIYRPADEAHARFVQRFCQPTRERQHHVRTGGMLTVCRGVTTRD